MSESPENVSIDCECPVNGHNKRHILHKEFNESLFRAAQFIFRMSVGSYKGKLIPLQA